MTENFYTTLEKKLILKFVTNPDVCSVTWKCFITLVIKIDALTKLLHKTNYCVFAEM